MNSIEFEQKIQWLEQENRRLREQLAQRSDQPCRLVENCSSPTHTDESCEISLQKSLAQVKQVQSQLEQGERKFRALFEQSADPMVLIEAGAIVDCNPAAIALLGCTDKSQVLQRTPVDFSPKYQPDGQTSAAKAVELIDQALQTGSCRFEWVNCRVDGEEFWVEVVLTAIVLDGKPILHSVFRDISDNKRAECDRQHTEAELRKTQQRQSLLIQQTPLAVIEWSVDFEVQAWNPAAEHIFGYCREEVMGQRLGFLIPEDLRQCIHEICDSLLKQQGGHRSINQNVRKDGSVISCEWYNTTLIDINGNIVGIASMAMDVSDRIHAENTLRESEARLRNINSIIPGAIYECRYRMEPELNARFTYLSPKACEVFGLEPAALSEQSDPVIALVHPQDFSRILESIIAALENQSSWQDDFRIITPAGQEKWIRGQSEFAGVEAGELIHNGIFLDVSDRKRAESALRASEQQLRQQTIELQATLDELKKTQLQLIQNEKMSSLGQMVAGVAHEINNPVNFIHGNLSHVHNYSQDLFRLVQLYQQYYPHPVADIAEEIEAIDLDFLTEDLTKVLQSMRVGTNRIREIVLSLRNFSRLDEAEVKDVDLHEGIDSTLTILQNRLKVKPDRPEIAVIRDYGTLPLVKCYAGQLNQVFMNILSNAIDALEEAQDKQFQNNSQAQKFHSQITIRTEWVNHPQQATEQQQTPYSSFVRVAIADNGTGIPEDVRSRLFDPFFTTKPVGKGTGLGLSISYQIVTEKHNGKLYCYSTPGEGTEFVIEIPVTV